MDLVSFAEARDLQSLIDLVSFAEARDLQSLMELVWLAGARAASVVGETAALSILSVGKLVQVLLRQHSES